LGLSGLLISLHSSSSSLWQSSAVDLKTKEEKDAELDRRIEALRKKNEALVKRYQVRRCEIFLTNTHRVYLRVFLFQPRILKYSLEFSTDLLVVERWC